MISIHIQIKNLWQKRSTKFKNLFCLTWLVTKYRVLELESYRHTNFLIELELSTDWSGRDHAGPELSIGLIGYTICVKLYDTRHWDSEKNEWITK